jgi:hypothetical protein
MQRVRTTLLGVGASAAMLLSLLLPAGGAVRVVLAATPTSSIKLNVTTAYTSRSSHGPKKGAAVTQFKWLLNLDNTGDPHQSNLANGDSTLCHPATGSATQPGSSTFPQGCNWPSIHQASASPVLSTGTEADWNAGTPLPLYDGTHGLPDKCDSSGNPAAAGTQACKYLVSVTAAGYQLGGAHFTVPATNDTVQVQLNPYPLPLGTIRVHAFPDVSPTDGTYEADAESWQAASRTYKLPIPHFRVQLADFNGVVSVDFFGNPLCTQYRTDANGKTIVDASGVPTPIPGTGGICLTDNNGDVAVPNLASNRYAVSLIPATGQALTPAESQQTWVQTTTLEGNHDFDVWLMPNTTGYDTEMVVGGEPVPFVHFGFVPPTSFPASATPPTGEVKGQLQGILPYVPGIGGLPGAGNTGGVAGLKLDRPVKSGYVSLSDMQNSDRTVYAAPADPVTGAFDVKNVPDGTYLLSVWDLPQEYLIDGFNITVSKGNVVDVGTVPLVNWFAHVTGKICVDTNGNGRCDPGEAGVPNFVTQLLNRTNNTYEQGQQGAITDKAGNYDLKEAYPLGQFTVVQAFNQRYKTIGVTWQACNDPQEHTTLTGAVDVSMLPVFSQCGRLDWAVQPYQSAYSSSSSDNGGIVATVIYDEIRQKYNARQAQTNIYQTGIPGVHMQLSQPVQGTGPGGSETVNGTQYALNADGSYVTQVVTGGLTDYTSEDWGKPNGCVPRSATGQVLPNDPNSRFFQDVAQPGGVCIEAPLTGLAFGLGTDYNAANAPKSNHPAQTVDGNYTLTPPNPGDWVVKMNVPQDQVLGNGANRALYKVTTENDVNSSRTPAQWVPQNAADGSVAWPPAPVAVPNMPTGDYQENPHTSANGPDTICAGSQFTVNVTDPNLRADGGSPLNGTVRHTCDLKLIHTQAGQSVAPNFHLWTDVPLPTKFSGYITDDASVSTNPRTAFYGEVAGVPNVPIGIYDWTGNLVHTVDSDYNGVWETLLPSSDVMCPTPAGFCPSAYRFVGNDPGQPGAPNHNHNPNYRTISAEFQAWPGVFSPADVAPTRHVTQIQGPPGQFAAGVVCSPKATEPQVFAVSQPYVRTGSSLNLAVNGLGFGATAGALALLDSAGASHPLATTGWTDTSVSATVNGSALAPGTYQLQLTQAGSGVTTVNAVTFHVLGGVYNPALYEVGPDPSRTYHTVQSALEAAARNNPNAALVVVYPNTPSSFTPLSAYFENIVIHSVLKLQGVGPGGTRPDGTSVPGSVLDGTYFNSTAPAGTTGEPTLVAWYNLVSGLQWLGNQTIQDAEVVYVLTDRNHPFTSAFKGAVDGFAIQNGNQNDFPGNLAEIGGAKTAALPPAVVTQGGAIFLNGYADSFQITNNLVQSNNGTYGSIRVGTPLLPGNVHNHNPNVRVSHNRVMTSGGTNLAGALGLFSESDRYRVDSNVFCGNLSAEYGGAISHYGLSHNGRIDHNKIYLNQAVDEGGGVMIAGELPPIGQLSHGAGAVTIDHNYIGANLANDDGGGLRFLMAGNFKQTVYDNMITNNVSLHEGGGVALDDTPNVVFANNTVAKNLSTATAVSSNGQAAPAGLSTVKNSVQLQASLPAGSSTFSNPTLQNNVFWDNRAGSWSSNGIQGIGLTGDTTPINRWDLGVADGSGYLAPHNSVMNSDPANTAQGWTNDGSNTVTLTPGTVAGDNSIGFAAPFDLQITTAAQRTFFRFRPSTIVTISLPDNAIGDYHLTAGSPAIGRGVLAATPNDPGFVNRKTDIDDQARTGPTTTDAGADQLSSAAPLTGGTAPSRSLTPAAARIINPAVGGVAVLAVVAALTLLLAWGQPIPGLRRRLIQLFRPSPNQTNDGGL